MENEFRENFRIVGKKTYSLQQLFIFARIKIACKEVLSFQSNQ